MLMGCSDWLSAPVVLVSEWKLWCDGAFRQPPDAELPVISQPERQRLLLTASAGLITVTASWSRLQIDKVIHTVTSQPTR